MSSFAVRGEADLSPKDIANANSTSKRNTAESDFIQQLEHEIKRIKDIIKKPKLVETKFKELINLHIGVENMINEYIRTSGDEIKIEVREKLKKWCEKYRSEWKTDIERLDELNMKVLKLKGGNNGSRNGNGNNSNGSKNNNSDINTSATNNSNNGNNNSSINVVNIKIPSFNEMADKIISDLISNEISVSLFDESIYGEMNEYIDTSLKKEDLERKEVKKMILAYNELREEIEDGLDEVLEEVVEVEKKWMKVRGKLEEKGMKWLEVLYVCHLNYLKSVMRGERCGVRVNGEDVKGKLKMMDRLRGWLIMK